MSALRKAFDDNISTWKEEQSQPWMGLRYAIEQANIQQHIGKQQLRILDAGGGNGLHAIAFARQGHHVSLVDFSAEMLADGRRVAEENGVADRIEFHHTDINHIPGLFPEPAFDLVLCHNVIQYVDDVDVALRAVCRPLRANGFISLVTPNSYSEVYKAAIRQLDLERAQAQLYADQASSTIFGIPLTGFTDVELFEFLNAVGCTPLGRYGIRCLCDWLPNEPKSNQAFMAQLEKLELAMTSSYPYYLLARYIQVIARKEVKFSEGDEQLLMQEFAAWEAASDEDWQKLENNLTEIAM